MAAVTGFICARCHRPVRMTRFGWYGHIERLPRGTSHYVRPVAVQP